MAAPTGLPALEGQPLFEVLSRALHEDTPGVALVCRAWHDVCVGDPRLRIIMLRRPRSSPADWMRAVDAFGDPAAVLNDAATLKAASTLVGGSSDVVCVLTSLLCDAASCEAERAVDFLLPLCEAELTRALPPYRARMLYHVAATTGSQGLPVLRRLWPLAMRRRLGNSRLCALDLLEMAAFVHILGEGPVSPARLDGVEWLMAAVAAETCAEQCWSELWAKVPEVAAALLKRPGVASRHEASDACTGVCSEANVLAVAEAFGAEAVERVLGDCAGDLAVRGLDAFDLPLVRRAARLVASSNGDPDELASAMDNRRYMDPRLLRAAYEGLRAASSRKRRAVLRRCVLARDPLCVDVGLALARARPPELPPRWPSALDADVLEGIAGQARARGAWETYGWLLEYARTRHLLEVVRAGASLGEDDEADAMAP